MWAKWDGVFLHGLQVAGQNTTIIIDSSGGHGLPPLGVCEQVALVAPIISEGTTEEDIETKHHQLLLLLPWELTHTVSTTAKGSSHHLNLPKAHCQFPGPCN